MTDRPRVRWGELEYKRNHTKYTSHNRNLVRTSIYLDNSLFMAVFISSGQTRFDFDISSEY